MVERSWSTWMYISTMISHVYVMYSFLWSCIIISKKQFQKLWLRSLNRYTMNHDMFCV